MHGVIDKYAIVLAWGWSLDAAWALRVTRRRYEEHVMRRKEQGQQVNCLLYTSPSPRDS